MTFQDFLESLTAKVRRELDTTSIRVIPEELRLFGSIPKLRELFESAHLFNLGEAEDLDQATRDLLPDLLEDCAEDVPAPFDNMLVFFQTGKGWSCEWHLKPLAYLPSSVAGLSNLDRLRLLIDCSEPLLPSPVFSVAAGFTMIAPQGGRPGVVFPAHTLARAMGYYRRPASEAESMLRVDVEKAILRVAVISHPANYIVSTTPALTPREERITRERGESPVRKRPHYIVIDREGLLRLNPATREPGGIHASPVPHSRRGHWRRLSERCAAARVAGRTKTWVPEAYVGEREFADEKNRYRVILGNVGDVAREPKPVR